MTVNDFDVSCARYRVGVVASTASDVVHHAGGWLFDQARAGWTVTVMLGECADTRPIRILGADTVGLESAEASMRADRHPHVLAVAADLYGEDSMVRRWMRMATDDRLGEVMIWGQPSTFDDDDSVCSVEHRLSAAARVFKAQALAAAGEPTVTIGQIEQFRTAITSDGNPRRTEKHL